MPHALKVAGFVNPLLDIYFPIALFERAPKYFSQSTPFRIVPVLGDGEKQAQGEDGGAVSGSIATGLENFFERILQASFSTCVATQQAAPGKPHRIKVKFDDLHLTSWWSDPQKVGLCKGVQNARERG